MLKTLPLKFQLGIGFGAVLAVFAAVMRATTLGAKSLSFL